MASFNRVILMGNLTRNPDPKALPSGTQISEFGVATNRRFKNSQGEQQEEVTFVDCTAFGRTAEIINQYFSKGKPIMIEGRLKFDQWQDQNGNNRSKLRVVVENFQFISDGSGGGQRQSGGYSDQQDQHSSPPSTDYQPPESIPEDDIPF